MTAAESDGWGNKKEGRGHRQQSGNGVSKEERGLSYQLYLIWAQNKV